MTAFDSLADDFYSNLTLTTELPLSGNRESILHYAEQLQKRYPELLHFFSRAKNDYVIEGDKEGGRYRWSSVEPRRISSGCVNPTSLDDAINQHRDALEIAPYALTISPLDCESIDLLMGFDFTYRGDHNRLVAEALGFPPAFEKIALSPQARFVNHEPNITLAIDDECRVQCRIGVETRTSPYQIRTGEFSEEQLSVYVTTRRFGSLDTQLGFAGTLDYLAKISQEVVENYVIESVLEPLAKSIAIN
jgi:hypothetical protein